MGKKLFGKKNKNRNSVSREPAITSETAQKPPELARKRQNYNSTFKMGRTIGEEREKLETKNERNAARKKDKKRRARRVTFTIFGFTLFVIVLVLLGFFFVGNGEPAPIDVTSEATTTTDPTIEIVDEDAATGEDITKRMKAYIGQAEQDFRDLGYKPTKAVVPSGSIREVDFYLEGYSGFIKTTIDRGSAVSVEDADRMLRYLAGQGTTEFAYIDVRIDGKAFWK